MRTNIKRKTRSKWSEKADNFEKVSEHHGPFSAAENEIH